MPCVISDIGDTENGPRIENGCPWGCEPAKWFETDEYEIVKKKSLSPKTDFSPCPECKTPKTPNCALCVWKEQVVSKIDGYDALNQALERTFFCAAQAGKSCVSVYGSGNCIALYSQKKNRD